MFTDIFDNRNKMLGLVIKLGDYLGRSLRENTILCSIDTTNNTVMYMTESEKLISGKYKVTHRELSLTDIVVSDSSRISDEKVIDALVEKKLGNLIDSLYDDDYLKGEDQFRQVLSLWETRSGLPKLKKNLEEKTIQFNDNSNILNTPAFKKLCEVTPNLIEFLKVHKDQIFKINEINNGLKLSNMISRSFNIPKITIEDLEEEKEVSYDFRDDEVSVYESICRQELIKRELLESKQSFEAIWASNSKLHTLAGNIFSPQEEVNVSLCEAIMEVPYLALSSKKMLFETLTNILDISSDDSITPKDIKKFASKLFEIKKPIKEHIIKTLNEKYGINILSLNTPPTFGSLANTQIVIFETLSKISPKGGVQKAILTEFAQFLKGKKGVQILDINDFLQGVFYTAGYTDQLTEMMGGQAQGLGNFLDFNKLADELGSLGAILRLLSAGGQDMGMQAGMSTPMPPNPMGQEMNQQMGDPGAAMGMGMGMGKVDPTKGTPGMPQPGQTGMGGPEALQAEDPAGVPDGLDAESEMGSPSMDADAVPVPEEGFTDETDQMGQDPMSSLDPAGSVDPNEIMMVLKELEAMIADLGGESMSPEEEMEMGGEEEMMMGGEEEEMLGGEEEEMGGEEMGMEDEEGGAHVQDDKISDEEVEDEEENFPEVDKKKKKSKPNFKGKEKE